jgi:hypothetical protein
MPPEKRTSPVVYSTLINGDFTIVKDGKISVNPIKLYDRDIVKVFSIPRVLTEYVVLSGAVYRKGRYGFTQGMTLQDLITKSGGMLADAYTSALN